MEINMENKTTINNIHSGQGDIIDGDKIVYTYTNFDDYIELTSELERLQQKEVRTIERIKKHPDEEDYVRDLDEIHNDQSKITGQIESIREAVRRLTEIFNTTPVDSARWQRAKAYFKQGKLREADAILQEAEIDKDSRSLKEQRDKRLEEMARINRELEDLSREYLLKAQLWQTFYTNPDWFERTCDYFEKALDTVRTSDTLCEYASFLNRFSLFDKAEKLYEEALIILKDLAKNDPQKHLPIMAQVLDNLIVIHSKKHESDKILHRFREILNIYSFLIENYYSEDYLPRLAIAKTNMADFYSSIDEFEGAEAELTEAMQIYNSMKKNSLELYSQNLAMTANSLGIVYSRTGNIEKAEQIYKKALDLYSHDQTKNPQVVLPAMAGILINLAILHARNGEYKIARDEYHKSMNIYLHVMREYNQIFLSSMSMIYYGLAQLNIEENQLDKALGCYEEALKNYKNLAKDNPQVHLPDVARILNDLVTFYDSYLPDRDKAIAYAFETIAISRQFPHLPQCCEYYNNACRILETTDNTAEKTT